MELKVKMTTELQELYTEVQKLYNPTYILNGQCPINHIDDLISTSLFIDNTMFIIACYYKNIKIIKRCLELGADLNKISKGMHALEWALLGHYDYKVIELLLQSGANPNIGIHTISGKIPIIFYLSSSEKLTDLLIKYGAILSQFHKYEKFLTYGCAKEYFINVIAKRRWVYIKCAVLILSVHKRAVERVNHPDRLKLLGVFEI